MRHVLDTNILVRADISPQGPAQHLIGRLRSDNTQHLVLSWPILDELREVLSYPRLQARHGLNNDEIDKYIRLLEQASEVVIPMTGSPIVRSDPDDDVVLYTAVTGHANVLCTCDTGFWEDEALAFCAAHGIEVMTDVELLRSLKALCG